MQKKYNTTVQQLIDLNKLHNTVLSVGQNIVISEKDIKEEKNSFDYQQFLKQNLGTGTLKVQTLIGTTYFPIQSVKIEIYKDFNGKSELFFQDIQEIVAILMALFFHVLKEEQII